MTSTKTITIPGEQIAPPHADARQRNTWDPMETYYDHLHEWYTLGIPKKKGSPTEAVSLFRINDCDLSLRGQCRVSHLYFLNLGVYRSFSYLYQDQ